MGWDKLASRSGRVSLYWVRAHAAESEVLYAKYRPSAVQVVGNDCADMLANFGARLCVVEPKTTDQVLSSMSLVHLVQKRMLAILLPLLVARPKMVDSISLRLPPGAVSLGSVHQLVAPGFPFCLQCGWGPRGPRKQTWL